MQRNNYGRFNEGGSKRNSTRGSNYYGGIINKGYKENGSNKDGKIDVSSNNLKMEIGDKGSNGNVNPLTKGSMGKENKDGNVQVKDIKPKYFKVDVTNCQNRFDILNEYTDKEMEEIKMNEEV